MAEEIKEDKAQEDWMTKKWRPLMAMQYMAVCLFDFILGPILWTIVQFWEMEAANDAFRQWAPMTLGGGGLYHMAMGAVLGISAWSRGQEKMAGVAAGPVGAGPTSAAPQTAAPTGFNGTSAADIPKPQPAQVKTGFNGKPAPQQDFPPI